eukprot:PITA_24141
MGAHGGYQGHNEADEEEELLEVEDKLFATIVECQDTKHGSVQARCDRHAGLRVDPAKIIVIINLEVPRSVKLLRATLGHTGYYQKFIKSYAQIIVPMEKLLKKDNTLCRDEEFQWSLDVLKEKTVTVSILVFLDWKKDFHVHVDASCIALGAVLTQDGEEEMDHPIVFSRKKLSKDENNYLTTECE